MLSANIGKLLRDWRKAKGVKQESLAAMLGVSQSAISHWETGQDAPDRRVMGRIVDIISATGDGRLAVEKLVVAQQGAIRASFDLDGVKLVMASKGLIGAWPTFSTLVDTRLIDRLVDEAGQFLHDDAFVRSVRRGEVAMVSAVSDKHIDLDLDRGFRHRWIAVFRGYGQKMLVDMTYETCDANCPRGIESVTHYDSLGG